MSTYTTEQEQLILASYGLSEGNAKEAVRTLNQQGIIVSDCTVRTRWKASGYELRGRLYDNAYREKSINGRSLTPEDEAIILKRYDMYSGSPNLAARSMTYSQEQIAKAWSRHGLFIAGRRKPPLERIVEEKH